MPGNAKTARASPVAFTWPQHDNPRGRPGVPTVHVKKKSVGTRFVILHKHRRRCFRRKTDDDRGTIGRGDSIVIIVIIIFLSVLICFFFSSDASASIAGFERCPAAAARAARVGRRDGILFLSLRRPARGHGAVRPAAVLRVPSGAAQSCNSYLYFHFLSV